MHKFAQEFVNDTPLLSTKNCQAVSPRWAMKLSGALPDITPELCCYIHGWGKHWISFSPTLVETRQHHSDLVTLSDLAPCLQIYLLHVQSFSSLCLWILH